MRTGLVFMLAALVADPAHGQVARENYGALLEPEGVIMHGAGQSDEAFED